MTPGAPNGTECAAKAAGALPLPSAQPLAPRTSRPRFLPIGPVAVFFVAAWLYHNATLNHFYIFGSSTDSLWFAGMLWHGDWLLHGPPGIEPRSFYTSHFTPLLVLPALLTHLLPFDHVEWLALVLGNLHGLLNAAFAWCAWRLLDDQGARPLVSNGVAAACGAGLAFSGLQAVFMGLPHIEIAVSAMLVAFLGALACGARRWATVWFVALLLAREDGGFHAFSFLAPLIALEWWRTRRWLRVELFYAGTALLYSLLVFGLKPYFIDQHVSWFSEHFIGTPPFAQLTWEQITYRLRHFVMQSGHIWGPLLALTCGAILRGDATTAVGAIAVAPWVALHTFFGLHITIWTMGYYYTFPVLSAVAWPTLLALYCRGPARPAGNNAGLWWLQAVTLLMASLPTFSKDLPFHGSRFRGTEFTLPAPTTLQAGAYREFARRLNAARPELGTVAANLAAIGLAPFTLKGSEWLESVSPDDAAEVATLDSILLFAGTYSCPGLETVIRRAQHPYVYTVPGTRLWLFTRKPPTDLPALAPVLARAAPRDAYCGEPPP